MYSAIIIHSVYVCEARVNMQADQDGVLGQAC